MYKCVIMQRSYIHKKRVDKEEFYVLFCKEEFYCHIQPAGIARYYGEEIWLGKNDRLRKRDVRGILMSFYKLWFNFNKQKSIQLTFMADYSTSTDMKS